MKNKILISFFIISLLLSITVSYAQMYDVNGIRDALRKALYDYFTNSSGSKLNVSEIKDLLSFYLSIPSGSVTVDCSGIGPNSTLSYSTIVNKTSNITVPIPTCTDNTEFGTCSNITKPKYCYAGRLIDKCDLCGCSSNMTQCDSTGSCKESTKPIVCNVDPDCGNSSYTGNYFCSSGDVYRNYILFTCNNPKTTNSFCSNFTQSVLIDHCNANETCVAGSSSCSQITTYQLYVFINGTGTGTVNSTPAGINCGSTCSANYASGTSVFLTANTSSNSTFNGWYGACSGTGVCNVSMNSSKTVGAIFYAINTTDVIPPTFSANAANATLAGQPANFTINVTDNVNLNSSAGYIFATSNNGTWKNASYQTFTGSGLTLKAWNVTTLNSTVGALVQWRFYANDTSNNWASSAVYNLITTTTYYLLSVFKTGNGTGTVTSTPAGINCGATCSANYSSGTSVILTATPSNTSIFAGWSGACSGTGNCNVSMDSSKSVTATFNPTSNGFSLQFDGVDDYVDLGTGSNLNPTSAITIAAWVKLNAVGASQEIVRLGDNNNDYYGVHFMINASGYAHSERVSSIGAPLGPLTGASALATGIWYHIVASMSSSGPQALYVNGISMANDSNGGTIVYTTTHANYISKATSRSGYSWLFNGTIDDVRIYNRTLNATEISQLYQGMNVSSIGLVGWWRFDEGAGNSTADASGNGNTGTLTNGPVWSTNVHP